MEEHCYRGFGPSLLANSSEVLPRPSKWNSKDKGTYLGLTRGNLRAIYKGPGKTSKDASAVRADHPIHPSFGLFYFEVTVVSKGKEGNVVVGLSTKQASLGKLPGSEKASIGYHGYNGLYYGNGAQRQKYGPKYETGDVIGCCVNTVTRSCFFTYNGISLGYAFEDLPREVYPTVGLNSPNELVEVNFGQMKFRYDFENFLGMKKKELCAEIRAFPVQSSVVDQQSCMDRMVLSYLVHHGYLEAARCLARKTSQVLAEPEESIRNRQAIQQLVLAGDISSAVKTVNELYPRLFDRFQGLLFNLHCRQFIEMIAGVDDGLARNVFTSSLVGTVSPSVDTSSTSCETGMDEGSRMTGEAPPPQSSPVLSRDTSLSGETHQPSAVIAKPTSLLPVEEQRNHVNGYILPVKRSSRECEEDMDMNENGVLSVADTASSVVSMETEETSPCGSRAMSETSSPEVVQVKDSCAKPTIGRCDVFSTLEAPPRRKSYLNSAEMVERLLKFGIQLKSEHQRLSSCNMSSAAGVKKLMEEAFSLIAYTDPWSSPASHLLQPCQREAVCSELNGAILNYQQLVPESSLELTAAHANSCLRKLVTSGVPASLLVTLQDICLP